MALAEHVAGSEEIFVEKMNKRAKELGMVDTHFVNTNGLPVAEHYTSAYDIALMSKELLKYEEPREWFKTWQTTITIGLPGKEKEFGLTNTNKLIRQYPGAIGIKTGFTADAGYCLSAAAQREETCLIAVILGCKTIDQRTSEIKKMLDFGFANYRAELIAKKGQIVKKLIIPKGSPQQIDLVTETDIKATYPKGDNRKIKSKVKIDTSKVTLPIKAGTVIGKMTVYKGKEKVGEYNLVSKSKVNKASLWQLYIRQVKKLAEN